MKKQRAGIYERRGFLYIRSSLQTEAGVWTQNGPCTKLAADAPASEIGAAMFEALSRSGEIIPHPTVWKSVNEDNPILEAAGIKSWSTFCRGARVVTIGLDGDELVLTPTVQEGRQGFTHSSDHLHLPATATDAEFGEAIIQALAQSK